MLKLTVPAHMLTSTTMIEVLACTVVFTDLDGHPHGQGSGQLALPVVDPVAFAATAEDELAVRRSGEVRRAAIQMLARDAALNENWAESMRSKLAARSERPDLSLDAAAPSYLDARQDRERGASNAK